MGEYADYMLNGDDCQYCGEHLGNGPGYPRSCASCSGGEVKTASSRGKRFKGKKKTAAAPVVSMVGAFLIRTTGKGSLKSRAHIWNGSDTACRMWSTGGIIRNGYYASDDKGEKRVCAMCKAVSSRGETDTEQLEIPVISPADHARICAEVAAS